MASVSRSAAFSSFVELIMKLPCFQYSDLPNGEVLFAGLALVIPSGQSLVADYYPAASRGSAFGALYLTSALGGMGGSFFATNLGKIHCAPRLV